MSKDIPNNYSKRNIINYRTRSPILADDWLELADQQNRVFEGQFATWGSHIFDDPAQTTSETFTSDNSNGRNLDSLNFGGVIARKLSGDTVLLGFETFGFDCDCRATFTNEETGSSLGTVQTSHGSQSAWLEDYISVSYSDIYDATNDRPQFISASIEYLRNVQSGSATWIAVRFGGKSRLQASDLPTADAI